MKKRQKLTTYFITRHGYSCSNDWRKNISSNPKYINTIFRILLKDPNLHNFGIVKSINSKSKKISSECDEFYVSPLIRTWQTASLMFPNVKKMKIGPYLRERTFKKLDILNPSSDIAYPYKKNVYRFKIFNKYVKQKYNINSTLNIVENDKKLKNQVYGPGDLKKFIKWHSEKNNNSKKVLIVCHGNLIKSLLAHKKRLIRKIKKVNNYIIKVQYNNYKKKIKSISIIYKGIKQPKKQIGLGNSLCN